MQRGCGVRLLAGGSENTVMHTRVFVVVCVWCVCVGWGRGRGGVGGTPEVVLFLDTVMHSIQSGR